MKVKRKGAYQYDNLGWHQDHSALVVPKAAEAYMLYDTDIATFITNHDNKWDFMLRAKVPRSSKLVMVDNEGNETLQQNICRYYASKAGGKLVKIMPALTPDDEPRRIGIDKEWNVKVCNDMAYFSWDIDYDYYIAMAKKLVVGETDEEAVQCADAEVDDNVYA